MKCSHFARFALLATVASCAMSSGFAWAADAPASGSAPDASSADTPAPAEIIVTAQRRAEKLQDISIAATAVSGDELLQKAVAVQRDLQNVAPGITITKAGLTESINIRGIGLSSGSPQVANGVATYIDGLFQPPITQSFGFYDTKDVEVLRGPQGTLVGSNSTGGAVFINNNRPQLGKVSATIGLQYGSYNDVRENVAVNLPIGENLAIRFANNIERRDSYYTDLGPYNNQPDSLKEYDERLSVLFQSGGFSAYWKGELAQKETGGYAYQPILGTQYSSGRTGQKYVLDYDSPTNNFERAFNTLLELKYETDGGLVVRSLTGYQNKRINNTYDLDGTAISTPPVAFFGPQVEDQYVREREYTEEINIISPASKPFNFILGGYYQRNKIDVLLHINGTAPFPLVISPQNDKVTLGAFAQANYRLDSQWELQAGVRYSHFHVDGFGAVYLGGSPPYNFATIPQTGTEKDGRMTGKVALNFKPNENNLIYIFAARGYKPGGINPPGATFKPETVLDYEAGWKSTLLDGHVHTQIGAFYNKYNNFQMDVINPNSGQAGVVNLANGTIKGFEAQIQARIGGFSLDGGTSYVSSSFSSITVVNRHLPFATASLPPCSLGLTPPACFDYQAALVTTDGGPNLLSPNWTWNVGAAYDIDLGDAHLTPRINYSYVGSQWTYVTYDPQLDRLPAHHLVNASITLQFTRFKIEGYVNNLTKEFFITGQSGNNEFYSAPREFGIRLGASF